METRTKVVSGITGAVAAGAAAVMLLGPATPFDPCPGCVSDKLPHPRQPLVKPALGQAYTDPAFGTTVRRIAAGNPADGANAVVKPAYATMQVWNADESKMWLWHRQGNAHMLYDGKTYQFIRRMAIDSPTDLEHLYWDPIDPDKLYYPSNKNAQPRFMVYSVATNTSTVLRDFSTPPTNCPVGNWGSLLSFGRDPQSGSHGPRKIVGLQCHPINSTGGLKFLYSIAENAVLSQKSLGGVISPVPSGSEQFASMDSAVFDLQLNVLRTLTAASFSEHASVGWDTFNSVAFDDPPSKQGNLVSHDLTTGQSKVIIGPATGYPYPPSATHISALARGEARDWVVVGTVGDPATGQGVMSGELAIANVKTGVVYRVAHTRTVGPSRKTSSDPYCNWGYFGEPHSVLSPSGTRIAFGSDWECGSSVDTYVVELPSYTGQPPTPGPSSPPPSSPPPSSPPPPTSPPPPSAPPPGTVCVEAVDLKGCVPRQLGPSQYDQKCAQGSWKVVPCVP